MINDFSPQKHGQESNDSLQNQNQAHMPTSHDYGEAPTLDDSALNTNKPPKKHRFHLTKKQWIIVGIVFGVLLLAGGGFWAWKIAHPANKASVGKVTKTKKEEPKPTTAASNLTGLQVDPTINQRPVTGVMIENSPDARPQSGLEQAGVVFEAVAEGGITRFLALYQDTQPAYIGPIRSARPYYLMWLQGFDASIAHVGGSPEALNDIKSWGIKDLDQFANSGSYTRISSRYAPHNVYTSIANLNAIEAKKGYGASKYTSFARKADGPSKTPNARSIDFAISSYYYNSHFDYDSVNNRYIRSEGGAEHDQIDQAGTKVQITPKTVIALVMPQGIEADDLHTSYNTIGNGTMYVFQDGIAQQGTWSKTGGPNQFSFTDSKGQPFKLNAGQTWITVLGSAGGVSYK
jgi:hypothetical protein